MHNSCGIRFTLSLEVSQVQQQDCDVSPLKEQMKLQLRQISKEIERSLATLDNENYCLLSEFVLISDAIQNVESIAASFYLQCYLSTFTNRFLELSISIRHLSERRHGALVVIERNDSVDTFLHSGIPIGATLTHSLLESIFYTGSPLHDGAVLIKSDFIFSAGNVLPLSKALAGEKKLGTRHRAAIGLTEETDALVLVISEETGGASFAFKGKLYPINAIDPIIGLKSMNLN
ncbi:Diadenylate cyclase (c-di-AMP synthetase), DisA_N domain [Paenibacillus sp. GP183]|nr:Diadenylate cyclase (c-di-AMP synthetase), DisA_N domain [Paenibacillus sp. GP183]